MVGIQLARAGAIVAGICLAFVFSMLFLPVDRRAVELSRALRERMSGASREAPRAIAIVANRTVPAE